MDSGRQSVQNKPQMVHQTPKHQNCPSKIVSPALPSLRVRLLHPDARLPAYAHPGDAGLDLFAVESLCLAPGAQASVSTGIALALPPGTEGQVRPRSGLAARHGITVLNAPGTIDAGYRGELCVLLINHGPAPFEIAPGMRIAQLVVAPVLRVRAEPVTRLEDTARSDGGFGSTGD